MPCHDRNFIPMYLRTIYLAAFLCVSMLPASADAPNTQVQATPVTAETGADGVQRLAITLDSYSFSPAYIIVQAGKPVEFTLKNVSSIAPHSLKIDAPADELDLYQEVEPGKTATLSFTPAKPGTYEFYCDKKLAFFPSHRKKGMVGKLEVR